MNTFIIDHVNKHNSQVLSWKVAFNLIVSAEHLRKPHRNGTLFDWIQRNLVILVDWNADIFWEAIHFSHWS